MSCKHPTRERCEPPARTTDAEDEITEATVLELVLLEHPAHLTPAELSLAINRDKGDFDRKDAVERAVGELIGNGLCVNAGGLLVPTRPALCFERLQKHL